MVAVIVTLLIIALVIYLIDLIPMDARLSLALKIVAVIIAILLLLPRARGL
jgi:hypothetical protein